MKRKKKGDVSLPRRFYDVRANLSIEQLKAVSAALLAWNQLEASFDVAVCVSMEVPLVLWADVSSRINGFDGKREILLASAMKHLGLFDHAGSGLDADCINQTLDAISECKIARDGIAHARIFDPDDAVALSNINRGEEQEVIVTLEALDILYRRIEVLFEELSYVAALLEIAKSFLEAGRVIRPDDTDIKKHVRRLLGGFARLQEHQSRRKSLPPLPAFPQSPPSPPKTASGKPRRS